VLHTCEALEKEGYKVKYVPVTEKAQSTEEYRDYLSREGEDNEYYYDVKIKATKLLLENTENTFVTPVFNGSASLRDAAGHLIETVNKAVKNNTEINDEYLEKTFDEAIALYRLDQISASSDKITFGEMPAGSVVLLVAILICWIGMAVYVGIDKMKTKN
jgi:multiple sugar transport system substrate-binding protein